jgi:hypothetical protein
MAIGQDRLNDRYSDGNAFAVVTPVFAGLLSGWALLYLGDFSLAVIFALAAVLLSKLSEPKNPAWRAPDRSQAVNTISM